MKLSFLVYEAITNITPFWIGSVLKWLLGVVVTPVSRGAGSFPEVLSEEWQAAVSNSCAGIWVGCKEKHPPYIPIPMGCKEKNWSFTVRVVEHCKGFAREMEASVLFKVFKSQQGPLQPGWTLKLALLWECLL